MQEAAERLPAPSPKVPRLHAPADLSQHPSAVASPSGKHRSGTVAAKAARASSPAAQHVADVRGAAPLEDSADDFEADGAATGLLDDDEPPAYAGAPSLPEVAATQLNGDVDAQGEGDAGPLRDSDGTDPLQATEPADQMDSAGAEAPSEPADAAIVGEAVIHSLDLGGEDAMPPDSSAANAAVEAAAPGATEPTFAATVNAEREERANVATEGHAVHDQPLPNISAGAEHVAAADAQQTAHAPEPSEDPAVGTATGTPTKRPAPFINPALGIGSPFADGPVPALSASPSRAAWHAARPTADAPATAEAETPAATADGAPPARVRSVTFSDHTIALEQRGARSWRGSLDGGSLEMPPGVLSRRLFPMATAPSADAVFDDQENDAAAPTGRPARGRLHVDRDAAPASIGTADAEPGGVAARTPLARVASQPDAAAVAAGGGGATPGSQRKRARTKAARLAESQGSPKKAAAPGDELTGSAPGDVPRDCLEGDHVSATQPQESAALSQVRSARSTGSREVACMHALRFRCFTSGRIWWCPSRHRTSNLLQKAHIARRA